MHQPKQKRDHSAAVAVAGVVEHLQQTWVLHQMVNRLLICQQRMERMQQVQHRQVLLIRHRLLLQMQMLRRQLQQKQNQQVPKHLKQGQILPLTAVRTPLIPWMIPCTATAM
ncbi:hypothetical protein PIL02S_02159 [Paenibacillus illinoisensis]|uniref:Uncharacterized protein n=1 Tax=Paenibacillus illinoisensis TaxID=59845 RepID=A0A2W0C9B7_9BACL|nr:hypothetical protein PIL02S_02159 [Paenibacillus illinoisensis]